MSKKRHKIWKPKKEEDFTILQISEIKKQSELLNEWEHNFIFNIDIQYLRHKTISPKQRFTLNKIYTQLNGKKWKSANVELKQRKQSETKSNIASAQNVGGHSILRKGNMTNQFIHKPKKCLIQPPEGTVFYNGIRPPWK